MARAREKGSRTEKAIGRPKASALKEAALLKLRRDNPSLGIIKIAKAAGVGMSVAQRVPGKAKPVTSPAINGELS